MEINWPKSLGWVRQSEGGNDDDPDDAGGRTSRGITQREDNAYRSIIGMPLIDVWKELDQIINDIYHKSYWLPYCPTLPPGIDYSFFDEAVNAGPHQAIIVLQRSLITLGADLGPTGADGHIGVITSAALSRSDPAKLIDIYAGERLKVYAAIEEARPVDLKFDKGWRNRVEFCRANAQTLVAA